MASARAQPVLYHNNSFETAISVNNSTAEFTGGSSVVLGPAAYDDALLTTLRGVTWVAGGFQKKHFSSNGCVSKAGWCCFQNTGPDKFLCFLEDSSLTVYTQDGDSHIIPLPGRFTSMWPLPQGVLLSGSAGQGACILVHPLENIQPVAADGGTWSGDELVVWSSIDIPYLLTFNQVLRKTSLWSVSTHQDKGFVAVTPMRWPGTPATPVTQGLKQQAHTPQSRGGLLGSTGGHKKSALRLPNGTLSPLTFQAVPRSFSTPAQQSKDASCDCHVLLPSQEVPVKFHLLWEQQALVGGGVPDEAHLVTDDDGGLMLCVLSKVAQRVTALRLPVLAPHKAAEVAFSLSAISIAAVSATFRGTRRQEVEAGAAATTPLKGPLQQTAAVLKPKDLLVLHPDGRLVLYVGRHRVCSVTVPAGPFPGSPASEGQRGCEAAPCPYSRLLGKQAGQCSAQEGRMNSSQLSSVERPSSAGVEVLSDGMALQTDSDEEMLAASTSPHTTNTPTKDSMPNVRSLAEALQEPMEPVALKDAVGNRVTLKGRADGNVRICLPFAPTSQLTTVVLDALRTVLEPEQWWLLYGQWLSANGSCLSDDEREWKALAGVLQRWVTDPSAFHQSTTPCFSAGAASSTPSANRLSPGASTPVSTSGGNSEAWEKLLASDCHRSVHAKQRLCWATPPVSLGAETIPKPSSAEASCKMQAWRVLQALHSVYEDLKMNIVSWQHLVPFGKLLAEIARVVGALAYLDHYARDLGMEVQLAADSSDQHEQGRADGPEDEEPPDMFRALHELLNGRKDVVNPPFLVQQKAAPVQRSSDLLSCYSILADVSAACVSPHAVQDEDQLWRAMESGSQRVVLELVRRRWTLADLDLLPWGVALPLRQALHQCRSSPPSKWPQEAYVLIGRNDIAASMAASQEQDEPDAVGSAIVSTPLGKMTKAVSPIKKLPLRPPSNLRMAPTGLPGLTPAHSRLASSSLFTPGVPLGTGTRGAAAGAAVNTTAATRSSQQLLWPPEGATSRLAAQPELQPLPYTQRVHLTGAAAGLGHWGAEEGGGAGNPNQGDGMDSLDSTVAKLRFGRDLRLMEVRRLLRSSAPVVLNTEDLQQATDADGAQMQQIKLATMAVRTMALPLGRGALTLSTLHPLPTEPLEIPKLCMAGRLPEQNNAVVNLDLSSAPAAPGGGAFCDHTAWPEFHNGVAAGLCLAPSGHQLTRTWIVYNKPEEPSYTHAGLLMALGLTGHLSCLAATDLYRYLSQEHDATIVGVLLGMAAAKRCSLDTCISRMLFLHLPTRHPSSYPELEISSLVQAAALLGVGLLFQGSCHRLMAEVMVEEIGRRPGAANHKGEGGTGGGAHLHQGVSQDREGYALAAGMALGLITLGRGRDALGLADLHLEERLRYFMLGGSDSGTVASQRGLAAVIGQNSGTMDGAFGPGFIGCDPTLGEPHPRCVNTARDSSSGRSGGTVAEELAAAQGSSQVVLEGELVNMDVTSPAATVALGLMYLKTNDLQIAKLFVLPDTDFALSFVRPEHLQLRVLMRSLVLWDHVRPTEEWVQAQLPHVLRGPLSKLQSRGGEEDEARIPRDKEAMAQSHCYVIAGACLAVGIRFAGSCNAQAQELLRKYLLYFIKAKQGLPEPGTGWAGVLGRDVLESCVGVCALSLAVVMAGSGHLDTFKLLRALRKRIATANASNAAQPSLASPPTTSYTYGAHMAIGMGLGILFMGGGALTFSSSNECVAALVISLFPRFPTSTTDNRNHLQAFRHLYVLATQARSVGAVDVDTHQQVYVPLDIVVATEPDFRSAGSQRGGVPGLQPVVSMCKGAADVLAEYAAMSFADGTSNKAADAVSFQRVAPCLLPEKGQVECLSVKGPRYWSKRLDSSDRDNGLEAVYRTQMLFVQRKAGALSYADDPSGVRSLLSQMFNWGRREDGGSDLINLCATFGSDPFVSSFAQTFCIQSHQAASGEQGSQLSSSAADFASLCRGALYECITQEKSAALLPYLELWSSVKGLSPGRPGNHAKPPVMVMDLPFIVQLSSLRLAMAYINGSLGCANHLLLSSMHRECKGSADGGAQDWELLLNPAFLASCWQEVEEVLEKRVSQDSSSSSTTLIKEYLKCFRLPSNKCGSFLGAFLQLHDVPTAPFLRRMKRQLQASLLEQEVSGDWMKSNIGLLLAGSIDGKILTKSHLIATMFDV